MAGTGYVERGLHFFFLPLITFEVARVRGYLRKKVSSSPVKLNYVVNLEEPIRVASPTRINLEEPGRVNLEEPGRVTQHNQD